MMAKTTASKLTFCPASMVTKYVEDSNRAQGHVRRSLHVEKGVGYRIWKPLVVRFTAIEDIPCVQSTLRIQVSGARGYMT